MSNALKNLHVHPIEIPEHIADQNCWCKPQFDEAETNGQEKSVLIHNEFDIDDYYQITIGQNIVFIKKNQSKMIDDSSAIIQEIRLIKNELIEIESGLRFKAAIAIEANGDNLQEGGRSE